jgi:hypothetical protein
VHPVQQILVTFAADERTRRRVDIARFANEWDIRAARAMEILHDYLLELPDDDPRFERLGTVITGPIVSRHANAIAWRMSKFRHHEQDESPDTLLDDLATLADP